MGRGIEKGWEGEELERDGVGTFVFLYFCIDLLDFLLVKLNLM